MASVHGGGYLVLFMVLVLFEELIFSFNQGFMSLGSKLFVVLNIGFYILWLILYFVHHVFICFVNDIITTIMVFLMVNIYDVHSGGLTNHLKPLSAINMI